MTLPLLAGIELGGTKCVLTLATGPRDVRAQARVPTLDPEVTLAAIAAVLDDWRTVHGAPSALGIASFGPLGLEPGTANFGHVLSTPKPGWRDIDLLGPLADGRGVPVAIDTDVNGAALAEGRWGAARGLADFAYVTVGTGIGVGLVVAGRAVRGFSHSELGHIHVGRAAGDDWPGACPYHGDCVEGLASGPAIAARAGRPGADLPDDHPAWEFVAHALGSLAQTLCFATAPRRILIGGGVAGGRPALLAAIRRRLTERVAGYMDLDRLAGGVDTLIAPPLLGEQAGPLGAIALAADAFEAASPTAVAGAGVHR